MKRISIIIALLALSYSANAQFHYQDSKNPEMMRHVNRREPSRKEIVLPQVNGYNVYKADLHTHTVFSDGSVLPDFRVRESWLDGLDVMAVTEHVEYRPHEDTFASYMKQYIDGSGKKVKNNRLSNRAADEDGIQVDLNFSYNRSYNIGKNYGITVIRGMEITRDGTTVGHYNALFTEDNNKIYDPDPIKMMRNAKDQGAIIQHNHPGWRKTDMNYTETDKVAYEEGLIDGIEVMNSGEFYPIAMDRAKERGLFMSANSDIHSSTAIDYTSGGNFRPMTFILAEDCSLESLKNALKEDRTIACAFNTLCGSEQLLTDFFKASVSVRVINDKNSKGVTSVWLTNNTSLEYYLKTDGQNRMLLAPFSTIIVKGKFEDKKIPLDVLNMFFAKDSHLKVMLGF